MNTERESRIEQYLEEALAPSELRIKDQSHLHAGHAGAQAGLGHYDVRIVSKQFEGLSRIKRHQLVYASLGKMMTTDIHALRLTTLSASELNPKQPKG